MGDLENGLYRSPRSVPALVCKGPNGDGVLLALDMDSDEMASRVETKRIGLGSADNSIGLI